MYSHVVGVRLSVVGAVRPYAVTTAAGGTTDPVSVCHRRNIIDMQLIRKCHGIVSIVNSFTFHAYNVSTSNSFSLLHDLGDDSVFDPSFTSVHSPGSSTLIQVWLVPLAQAVLVVVVLGRDPVRGPAEVAMRRICIVRRRTTYASW